MQIKLLVSAAVIAVATTVGSASAAERFATLDAIEAAPLSPLEMLSITGRLISIGLLPTDIAGVAPVWIVFQDNSLSIDDNTFGGQLPDVFVNVGDGKI